MIRCHKEATGMISERIRGRVLFQDRKSYRHTLIEVQCFRKETKMREMSLSIAGSSKENDQIPHL